MNKDNHTNAKTNTLQVYKFTYNEHAWPDDDWEELEQAMLHEANKQEWNPAPEPEASDFIRLYGNEETERDSLSELQDHVAGFVVEELELSQEVVQIPFRKLQEKMNQERWLFIGGTFYEFEGHHNDTEIYVVLKKKI